MRARSCRRCAAAARTKPVVVLKAGRSLEPRRDAVRTTPCSTPRCGARAPCACRRTRSSSRRRASSPIGRIPRGDRLAIVSNGRGPALLAADSAAPRGVDARALRARDASSALDALLPRRQRARAIRSTCAATRRRRAWPRPLQAALADPDVDAVVALHVARPVDAARVDAARAVAEVARASRQAGARRVARRARSPTRCTTRSTRAASPTSTRPRTPSTRSRFSPRIAATRRGCSRCRRRSRSPSRSTRARPSALRARSPRRPARTCSHAGEIARAARRVRHRGAARARSSTTLAEARSRGARRCAFRSTLVRDSDAWLRGADAAPCARARALADAWGDIARRGRARERGVACSASSLARRPPGPTAPALAIGVATDPVFGPVITLGASGGGADDTRARVMLPPLNRRLALDLVARRAARRGWRAPRSSRHALDDALVRLLVQRVDAGLRAAVGARARARPGDRRRRDGDSSWARAIARRARARRPQPRLPAHGDPPVSGGADRARRAARRHAR